MLNKCEHRRNICTQRTGSRNYLSTSLTHWKRKIFILFIFTFST